MKSQRNEQISTCCKYANYCASMMESRSPDYCVRREYKNLYSGVKKTTQYMKPPKWLGNIIGNEQYSPPKQTVLRYKPYLYNKFYMFLSKYMIDVSCKSQILFMETLMHFGEIDLIIDSRTRQIIMIYWICKNCEFKICIGRYGAMKSCYDILYHLRFNAYATSTGDCVGGGTTYEKNFIDILYKDYLFAINESERGDSGCKMYELLNIVVDNYRDEKYYTEYVQYIVDMFPDYCSHCGKATIFRTGENDFNLKHLSEHIIHTYIEKKIECRGVI